MYEVVVLIAAEAGTRLKNLLRARPFYPTTHLMSLYKCHVLPFLESGTPAFYHAAPNILEMFDDIQVQFLESVSISKVDALINVNLAPLCNRRDIAMLGILQKNVLKIAPNPFYDLDLNE